MDELCLGKKELRKIQEGNRVVIYGFGEMGRNIYEKLNSYDIDMCVMDQNHKIQLGDVDTFTVNSFKWERVDNVVFIIASINHYDEMTKDLLDRGVEESNIIYPYEVLQKRADDQKKIIMKRIPRHDLQFVVCITEHCNLNCARCDHFSPLSEEWYMDYSDFERDMRRMSELCKDTRVSVIDIEGGEPLLHKDIVEFIHMAREFFPSFDTKIKVYTNALLLKNMGEDFWKECVASHITIRVTKYPIDLDYNEIRNMVLNRGVEFEFANDELSDKTMIQQSLDIEGNQNKYNSFHNCYMSNGNCAELRLGKFYQCNIIANLHIFNHYFDKKLEVTERDFVDIYSDITIDDIFDYLCNPAPACKYCKTSEWSWGNKWMISQKKIDEWT